MRASARKRTRSNGNGAKTRTARVALIGAAVLAAAAAALAIWSLLPRAGDPGATVSTYQGSDIMSIQAELDRQVKESMMTVAVSPICTLQEDGTLSLRVINDEDNRLAQSFTISQDGETIHESGRIDPGQEVTSCAAEGAVAGAALITVQGLDPETGDVTVRHTMNVSMNPTWLGQTQERNAHVKDGILTIHAPVNGAHLVWRKVAQ